MTTFSASLASATSYVGIYMSRFLMFRGLQKNTITAELTDILSIAKSLTYPVSALQTHLKLTVVRNTTWEFTVITPHPHRVAIEVYRTNTYDYRNASELSHDERNLRVVCSLMFCLSKFRDIREVRRCLRDVPGKSQRYRCH